jgi:hypothetical protein
LNSALGGDPDKIYLVTADMGSNSGSGLDFIGAIPPSYSNRSSADASLLLDGFVFLQRFYSVYDTGNSQLGLATTQFTSATTN